MDRNIVYPGSIPLDTDLLSLNRNVMTAVGYLALAVFGGGPVVDGLVCSATVPASMQIQVGPGIITLMTVVDQFGYGSLSPDTVSPLMKVGINKSATTFALAAPTVPGQISTYLVQATFQEVDTNPVVLPYYNASNPSQPYNGPANAGTSQPTVRSQVVSLQLKVATAAAGQAAAPPVDAGWIGLYTITVSYGQTAVAGTSIVPIPTAPFLSYRLPTLRPGFGSGCQTFTSSGSYVVPLGVQQVEVELWGGGAGTFASVSGKPSGGGSGGGYARKRITGLTPGQSIAVTVGPGGSAGAVGGAAPTAGGTSSFGTYLSATGGSLNPLATTTDPSNGATPAGVGLGGDVNLKGSAGQAGSSNQGGMGGASPMGGAQNSGTTGVAGVFPGGGASGAGTGADSATPYSGAAGAPGMVVVRW